MVVVQPPKATDSGSWYPLFLTSALVGRKGDSYLGKVERPRLDSAASLARRGPDHQGSSSHSKENGYLNSISCTPAQEPLQL